MIMGPMEIAVMAVSTGDSSTMDSIIRQNRKGGVIDVRSEWDKVLDKECRKLGFTMEELAHKQALKNRASN
jgi:hypothetical protein